MKIVNKPTMHKTLTNKLQQKSLSLPNVLKVIGFLTQFLWYMVWQFIYIVAHSKALDNRCCH